MRTAGFKERMLRGDVMSGTFVKTPDITMIEVLAKSGLDFICLDAEHAPFDRARMDACLAVARALDFPTLVRIPSSTPSDILNVMDMGAVGIVCPHVDSVEKAQAISKAARFGHGGRGYAGSTRWAGYTTRGMAELLEQSHSETVVIAQIEEPEGVDLAEQIAATDGIDGLFLEPADLSIAYGKTSQDSDELFAAIETCSAAAKSAGVAYMTFVPNAAKAAEWRDYGFSMFFVSSEHGWMLQGARATADGIKDIT